MEASRVSVLLLRAASEDLERGNQAGRVSQSKRWANGKAMKQRRSGQSSDNVPVKDSWARAEVG